jgi:hypothetical protein
LFPSRKCQGHKIEIEIEIEITSKITKIAQIDPNIQESPPSLPKTPKINKINLIQCPRALTYPLTPQLKTNIIRQIARPSSCIFSG